MLPQLLTAWSMSRSHTLLTKAISRQALNVGGTRFNLKSKFALGTMQCCLLTDVESISLVFRLMIVRSSSLAYRCRGPVMNRVASWLSVSPGFPLSIRLWRFV